MDAGTLTLVGLVALALLFDFTNGFHDSANSIATVVATRVLRPRYAVLWAAFFNFIAFLVVGTAVANTVGQTVKPGYIGSAVVFAALLGAITWNYASWHLGLPTSSSHALVGGLVGAGLARGGADAIKAANLEKTALFIVISPIAGMALGALVMGLLRLVFARADVGHTERTFCRLQLASSAAVSLGHGGNDAQKTMGIIAALLVSTGHLSAHGTTLPIPLWVGLAAATAIALGTMSGGWRIVRTMGARITRLRPVSGFSAETGAAVALLTSTALGAPVSTTHTVAGAITGVGTTNRATTVNWSVFGRVALAWLVTLPFAGLVGAVTYKLTTLPSHLISGLIMGTVLTGLATLLVVAVRRAPTAADVETDFQPGAEIEIPLRPGTGSLVAHRPARSAAAGSGQAAAELAPAGARRPRSQEPL
jgi:PiT family inorganic phosphate transporter